MQNDFLEPISVSTRATELNSPEPKAFTLFWIYLWALCSWFLCFQLVQRHFLYFIYFLIIFSLKISQSLYLVCATKNKNKLKIKNSVSSPLIQIVYMQKQEAVVV